MQVVLSREPTGDHAAGELIGFLRDEQADLDLSDAFLYYRFPIYLDDAEGPIASHLLLVSRVHGVVVVHTCSGTRPGDVEATAAELENVFSHLYSRLLKNRRLRATLTTVAIPIKPALYAPFLHGSVPTDSISGLDLLCSYDDVASLLERYHHAPIADDLLSETISTLEGAKGLTRPRSRDVADKPQTSKGVLASHAEAEIARFDQQQKEGFITEIHGPQRIRGLAGSGKTVILAMKTAITHLQHPDARLAYTFYTKSLYQHVRHLITRFYRQFAEHDPDWDRIHVLHAWGGPSTPGIYFRTCQRENILPLSFGEAYSKNPREPFEYACSSLLQMVSPKPHYDFMFVDEGQDFPPSFLRLCHSLAVDHRWVWAYDELQIIFQPISPTVEAVFGPTSDGHPAITFEKDLVLYRCYRNPREVIVCAHAIGFGLYATRPAQMLENRAHWEDIGYRVIEGDFVAGRTVRIERPPENSLLVISDEAGMDEIVQAQAFRSFDDEVAFVVSSIQKDIADGLRPDDILVVCVDDRNARAYLGEIQQGLLRKRILVHNTHADPFGIVDFHRDDCITLATVHKAKGNESFMVYVTGVDALFKAASPRNRNTMFTAMTRAKGWLRLTGVGEGAERLISELDAAKQRFPYVEFVYPSPEDLRIMKRDLDQSAISKLEAQRLLEQAAAALSPEEIEQYLDQVRPERKGSKSSRKPRKSSK